MVSGSLALAVAAELAATVPGIAGDMAAFAGTAAQEAAYAPIAPALILLLPLAGFAVNAAGSYLWRENRAIPSLVGPASVLAAFAVVALNFFAMQAAAPHDPSIVSYWTWMASGELSIGVDLQFDQLSIFMMLIVTGVSSIIHVYSIGYMRDDPGYSRYFAYLNLFVFFMLVLVSAANFPLMFVGWEGVGLCSYLLIGFWYENREYSNAGKKAFIVNRIGDVGFLLAMFLIFLLFGTLDFVTVFDRAAMAPYASVLMTLVTLLLFVACIGKSAQIPLHVWLPDAMAGPTPVSALIHAATMVTAGVYLVARSGVLFAMAPFTQAVVAAVGTGTALFAATVALGQYDIKKVLAYSTISQLGYMFLAVGIGAFTAGVFHLMTHAFFKALLFLGAGAVIHAMHHAYHETGRHGDVNDMRNHGGLRRWMPITWATMWVATLAIAGVFPFAGFFSKDEILWQAGSLGYPMLWAVAFLTALLTAGYMTRLMVLTFHGENRTFAAAAGGAREEAADESDAEVGTPATGGEPGRARKLADRYLGEVPAVMWIPLVILALLSVAGGWINIPEALPLPHLEALHHWLEPVFEPALAVTARYAGAPSGAAPLGGGEALWAGISAGLALAVIATVIFVLRRRPTPEAAAELSAWKGILFHAWYVDDLYDRLIVRPSVAFWRACWRVVDVGLVDRAVNGIGSTSRGIGWLGSQIQSGHVGTYIAVFVLGALVLLGTVAL